MPQCLNDAVLGCSSTTVAAWRGLCHRCLLLLGAESSEVCEGSIMTSASNSIGIATVQPARLQYLMTMDRALSSFVGKARLPARKCSVSSMTLSLKSLFVRRPLVVEPAESSHVPTLSKLGCLVAYL